MAESDSRDCVGILGSKREAGSQTAQYFVKNMRSTSEVVFERTELQLPIECCSGKLHLTCATGKSFLKMELQAEEKYDSVGGTSGSYTGMVRVDDHALSSGALCERGSKIWTQRLQVQAHGTHSGKMSLVREDPVVATRRKGVRSIIKKELS